MTVYIIIKWDGNTWKPTDWGFVSERRAKISCSGNDALKYKKVNIDVSCD